MLAASVVAAVLCSALATHVVPSKKHPLGLRATSAVTGSLYGSPGCQCIGFDNVKGEIQVLIDAKRGKMPFPVETGASCATWETLGPHPDCEQGTDKNFTKEGPDPTWCHQPWCYVDPCKCKLAQVPVVSAYLPDATYQAHPVYYSYATCGGRDDYTAGEHKAACVNQKTEQDCGKLAKCGWDGKRCAGKEVLGVCNKPLDEKLFGAENCRCIGIDKFEGSIEANLGDGKKHLFPASYGATCQAHESTLHPDCKGDKAPEWCDKAWCWVDPCSCQQEEPPKVTAGWMGDTVNFQGKTLYYSYTGCGSKDLFTEKYHKAACMNQKSQDACSQLGPKCAWTGTRCLGKELASTCGWDKYRANAQALAPLSAVLLLLALQF